MTASILTVAQDVEATFGALAVGQYGFYYLPNGKDSLLANNSVHDFKCMLSGDEADFIESNIHRRRECRGICLSGLESGLSWHYCYEPGKRLKIGCLVMLGAVVREFERYITDNYNAP
jgi:hypothetical protein